MSEYLFDHIQEVSKKIKVAEKILLFLDYDGTLVFFKNRPEQVRTSKKVKSTISKLIKIKDINVVIITGRKLNEINDLLDLKGLSYVALHGLKIKLSGGKIYNEIINSKMQKILRDLKDLLKKRFLNEKGLFLEDKEFTLAVHYRTLTKDKTQYIVKEILDLVKSIDTDKKLDILQGSKVIELRPKGWNKGKAVKLIQSLEHLKDALTIYIGDDVTDEDAFYVLKNKGLTIHVSNQSDHQTNAQFWLKDPNDVLRFLDTLENI